VLTQSHGIAGTFSPKGKIIAKPTNDLDWVVRSRLDCEPNKINNILEKLYFLLLILTEIDLF
jgi:hypothetical protein